MTIPPSASAPGSREPIRRIQVGDAEVYPLVQLRYRVDPARFFPEITQWCVDRDAWYWQEPYIVGGALAIDMGAFLVRTAERTILVDAGIGNDKRRPNPVFDRRRDTWIDALARTGTSLEEVDTVLFTHLHVDHVGFATSLRGGEWTPTFPHATYHTTAAELAYWQSTGAEEEVARLGDYIGDSILPLADAGRLQLSSPDARISEHVRLVPAAGHTPGNVCIELQSAGRRAVFSGDMIHHALQLAFPARSTDYCVDQEEATSARLDLLAGMGPDDLLFPAHFPGCVPGRVVAHDDGTFGYDPEWGEAV
ncbi:MBL fold metallo-hydrolase [Microbacterium terregens]|uniref:MBL fold metallo-hydrolase n=1 Tax=Microbacterium terregens TaxID=69363 RepID=A0ABV5T3K1_9MICO